MPRGELRLQGLVKRFGDVAAVDGIDLELPAGELIAFLGPSGCGKTTLLRLVAGLEHPTAGRVYLDGEDVTDLPPHTRDIGMVFQTLALFPHLNVAGNVGYGLRIRGVPKDQRRRRVDDLMALVALEGLADRRIAQLSGGQRQRVATARALALEPRLFLLDEPLSALDANLREQLQVELRLLQQKLAVTTIVVTHDQREAMTMADLVVVMRDGRVEQAGPPLEVYRRPANAFVARFMGTTNLLTAEASGEGLRVLGRPFTIGDGDGAARGGTPEGAAPGGAPPAGDALPAAGREVLVSVRPEFARIAPADSDEANALAGTVVFVRDLGEVFEAFVDCGLDDRVVVSGSPRDRVEVRQGDAVSVQFPPEHCVVVRP